jgi:hypothetical protein
MTSTYCPELVLWQTLANNNERHCEILVPSFAFNPRLTEPMELSDLFNTQIPRLSQEHVAHMGELEFAGRYDHTSSEHLGTLRPTLDRGSLPSSAREKQP